MKRVLICYFSGTGNTFKVVNEYVKFFNEHGYDTTLFNMDNKEFNLNILEYDLFGIAYPIHAFNAPSNILKFAKSLDKLPKKTKKSYFIIKTSGEPLKLNNISSLKLRSILKKKGYVLTNEYHYCMPYNIIFRHTNNMVYKMWNIASNVIPLDATEIINNKESKLSYVLFGRLLAFIFRIEHWGGRFNGKHYKVNDTCLKCGKCIKNCPTNNITIENNEFKFNKNCLMCMRCSFNCPVDAIKIGLFNKWKVNGSYDFNSYDENEVQTHQKYCKKSYQKYFARNQKRIDEIKTNKNI